MSSRCYTRPKWWLLYLTFPLLIGLFVLDSRLRISARGHQAVQIGIILIVYGSIHLWLKANAKALNEMDRLRYGDKVTVIRIQPYELTDADMQNRNRGLFDLSNSETKGMMGDTFEMDHMESKPLPIDEVPEAKKE